MIVRNEEDCLDRCLKSVCAHVDEIIVVDTGSTDRTVEIARGYGARIYHHTWENDFSRHRNQSLAYATGEWIFQLDADEELFVEDAPRLASIVREGKADYYHCLFHDIKKDGDVHGVFYLIRLFRNGMGMRYQKKVHNQLQTSGSGEYCPIRIRHYGYDLPREQMEAKHIRTTTLLGKMLESDPEDAYCLFQLASSYSMHREPDKAVAYGERALEIMRRKGMKNSFFLTAFNAVVQGYHEMGKAEEVERVCLEALERFPLHLDMCHILADLYFRNRDAGRYREMAHRYLSIHEAMVKNPSLMGSFYSHSFVRRNEIYFGLACIHFMEKDFEKADALFVKSREDGGKPIETAGNICRFYLEKAMNEKAMQWLIMTCDAWNTQKDLPGPTAGNPGTLAYEVAEAFCLRRQWRLAVAALELAIRVAPSLFDHGKFDHLLQHAE